MRKRLIVTADDFGLSDGINQGIIHGHNEGIITSTSMMMNAPAVDTAIPLARQAADLEVGLHLGVVEGLSLRKQKSSITDELRYIDGGICLLRSWKHFLARYFLGKIDYLELEEEFELQIQAFLNHFESIPFLNSTQHLHLLPRVREIVVSLCYKYNISALRIPHQMTANASTYGVRAIEQAILVRLGKSFQQGIDSSRQFRVPDYFCGFEVGGRLDSLYLSDLLENLSEGASEVVTHPGYECQHLRRHIPWGFRGYSWETELSALTDKGIMDLLREREITLCKFSDLSYATA